MRNLEKLGIITGYSANIDEGKLGFAFTVFVSAKLDHQIDDRLMNFEKEIALSAEVMDCWLMTGIRY